MLLCSNTIFNEHSVPAGSILGPSRPPRIISEIRKRRDAVRDQLIPFRPRISADLLVLLGSDRRWVPRRVQVRAGLLLLSPVEGCFSLAQQNDLGIRIPLRHLSLQAGPVTNSISLVRGCSILLTLQTSTEHQFDLWVKSIAIDIIRQTPLEDVKYLDVVTLTAKEMYTSCARSTSPKKSESTEGGCGRPVIHFKECDLHKSITYLRGETGPRDGAACMDSVEVILKKCQTSENYVPVKEKLVLFESLCRIGRGRSAEDVSMNRPNATNATKRARSMHDLTCFTNGGVREICKYFEMKRDDGGGGVITSAGTSPAKHIKRMVHSDSSLHRVAFRHHEYGTVTFD